MKYSWKSKVISKSLIIWKNILKSDTNIGSPHLAIFSYYRSNKSISYTVATEVDRKHIPSPPKWTGNISRCHGRSKHIVQLQLAHDLKIPSRVISPTRRPKLSGALHFETCAYTTQIIIILFQNRWKSYSIEPHTEHIHKSEQIL